MTSVKKIVVLKGDYIGPEIMSAGLAILDAATRGTTFAYELIDAPFGGDGIDRAGDPLPQATIDVSKQADAVLLSAIGGPKWDNAPRRPEQGLLEIRSKLNLFANIRPTKVTQAQIDRSPLKPEYVENTDFVIVRELTSGAYFGKPRKLEAYQAIDTMYYSEEEVTRIMHQGFKMAQKRRKHVTIVDKSNVLATSKFWRKIANEVGKSYPDVIIDYYYVDAMTMAIMSKPATFDVVIIPNLFGDILSDEAAQITGSIGQIASMSAGESGPNLYEPIHGSAPDIAGQGIANPISMVNTVAMMLTESFDEKKIADKITAAVDYIIENHYVTPDMGGTMTTDEVTQKMIDYIKKYESADIK